MIYVHLGRIDCCSMKIEEILNFEEWIRIASWPATKPYLRLHWKLYCFGSSGYYIRKFESILPAISIKKLIFLSFFRFFLEKSDLFLRDFFIQLLQKVSKVQVKSHCLIWFDAFSSALSNGKNRSSLPFSYQKLFKKYPPAFFFEMGSSCCNFLF